MLDVMFTDGTLIIEGSISPEELKTIMELKPVLEYEGETYKMTDLNYEMGQGKFTVWLIEGGGKRCVSLE
jgi:hypothetical protein